MNEQAMNENVASDVLQRYSKVAVIGAGVIGASWTAVFLAHGLSVVVNDPRDDVEAIVHDYIREATPTLKALGLPTPNLTKRLIFEADLDRAVADAVAFFKAVGKVPRVLRKEIQGFVANRLQRAIFRECCHLVLEGVVTVDELDDIVTSSIGLRWAADGPFRSFHLGGGPGGFVSFFRQFAPGMEAAWKSQAAVTLDEKSQKTIIDQAQASFAATPPEQLEGERDAKQLAILKALAAVKVTE